MGAGREFRLDVHGLHRGSLLTALLLTAILQHAFHRVVPVCAQETPAEIVDRVDRLLRGESSRGSVSMRIVTEHWTRSLDMSI